MAQTTWTRAMLRRPTGFREPAVYEEAVLVMGYTFGTHEHGGGYNRAQETTLAIVASGDGQLRSVPVSWLNVALPVPVPSPVSGNGG